MHNDPDGRGVVVGVIDTGIQSDHPGFGKRVARIWDQTQPGKGVHEGPYGKELRPGQLGQSMDVTGHGTHVAGIAAGAETPYPGVAPAATLVVVKTDFDSANIADGVQYVLRVASEMGMPAVVNLSLGGHFDAHDGSDPLCEIIDRESGEGRIVCCAAGNEGLEDIHAECRLLPDAVHDIEFHVPGSAPDEITLNAWYSGLDDAELALADPLGIQTPFHRNGSIARFELDGGDAALAAQRDPSNGANNVVIKIRPRAGQRMQPGTWRLRVRGLKVVQGDLHAWLTDADGSVRFRGNAVSNRMKIGAPGSASSAVTVASFTTRNEWRDRRGEQHSSSLPLDFISPFSSAGPLRNHAPKPDVAAPGAFLAAPMSRDASKHPRSVVRNGYCVKAGTSMACPVIAGMAALLLQENATLKPGEIKRLLRRAATIPGQEAGSFDTVWGYGLVDGRRP